MLSNYLHQTAEYKACTGTDSRGEPTFGDPVSVYCRKAAKAENILSVDGQIVKSSSVYLLKQNVSAGDMLDGMLILKAEEWRGLFGELIGCKAVV